jgi:hypothetical protein
MRYSILVCSMFEHKSRHWLSVPCHTITYTSWKQWKLLEVYSSPMWKDKFFPYIWNIRENNNDMQIQIVYTPLSGNYASFDGIVDIKTCIINIKESDEEEIRLWLTEQVWAHMV